MRRSALILALSGVVLATLMTPSAAKAQASITATATVASALTLTAGNDLDFQLVIPGFTKIVAVTGATAGTFSITGGAGAEVNFSFTSLPDPLTFGANNLPITYAGVHNTVNDPGAGATAFTPSAGATTNLSGTGELYIFMGGTVDATASPLNGTYTGTVTLTAAYTGS